MVDNLKTQAFCRLGLQGFDLSIREFFYPITVHAHHVIMVLAPVQFKYRRLAIEVVPGH
jgi:hypothetical protein